MPIVSCCGCDGGVALGLLLDALFELLSEVYACLIGQTEQYPEHICHLFAKRLFAVVSATRILCLPRLVAIASCDYSRQLSNFLCQNRHIRQF